MRQALAAVLIFAATLAPDRALASATSDDISRLELSASRGEQSASDDLNRGLAYLQRGLSPERAPQDLGQAIAGFESAQMHTSEGQLKRSAETALAIARAAVVTARTARGESPDFAPQGFVTAFLAARNVPLALAGTALAFSLALVTALLRRRVGPLTALLGVGWVCTLSLAVLAHRNHTRRFVVIAADVRPESPSHIPVLGAPLTQGALLHVEEASIAEAGWVQLRLHGEDVLLPAEALRSL